MDSKHLTTFMCVCKHLNFTKAAEELYLTQSAVSQQIHALESELGFPLLKREGGKVELLESGILFRDRAAQILLLYDRAIEESRLANEETHTTLTIGCGMSYTDWWLPEAIARFARAHPEVDGSVITEKTINLPALMQYGALDVIVCLRPDANDVPGTMFLPVAASQPRAMMRADNVLATKDIVTMEDLAQQRLIAISSHRNTHRLHSTFRELSQLGVDTANRIVVDCGEAAIISVACGFGIFPCMEFERPYAESLGLAVRPVAGFETAAVDVGFAFLKDAKLPYLQELVGICKTVIDERTR